MLAQLLANGVIGFPFHPHVDVFGVLPVNDHVQILGTLVGARGALVVTAGTDAGIQIKDLAQGHVQRTDATTHGCGEGAFDGHAVGADRLEGVLRQVLVGAVEVASFIAGVDLEPFDALAATVGLGHGRIQHLLGGGPDVHAGAIAPDEGNDRVVGHHGLTVLEADRCALARGGELLELGHGGWSGVSRPSL